MTDAAPVEALGLVKRYGEFTAVDAIDFRVDAGECVGILGPNGAGKTTTVRMLTCFSPVTAGTIRVFGHDVMRAPREVKSLLGICPQEDNLDPDFSALQNLVVFARYFGITGREAESRAQALLDEMALGEKASARIDALSGGMKRRLILARALINRPRMLVLDEPTTGLDPQARQLIWARVRRLRRDGTTVLLTTHYMEEATQLCDRVILIDAGKILLEGHPKTLVEEEIGSEVIELWNVSDDVRAFVTSQAERVEDLGDRLFVIPAANGDLSATLGARFPHQERLIRHATLEDVFLHRAGRTLRE